MGLKEIAKLTGYSVSTVSRVLNNKQKSASSKTESEIWSAAQQLHYIRNDAAASLKTGTRPEAKSIFRIGIILARGLESLEDEFYQKIEESVKTTVLNSGHQLGETFMMRTVLESPQLLNDVDGVVLIGKCKANNLVTLQSYCKNIACTGLNPYYVDIDQVYCNGEHIARTAVQYLLSKGHKKIGYVGECNGDVRFFGYRAAIKGNSLDLDSPYVFSVTQTAEGGRNAARQYITTDDAPTAVFCVNDVSAIGFIDAFKRLKPNHPLPAVVGIGDISTAADLSPSLSTIHLPLKEMGNIAARFLLDRMNGWHTIHIKAELPYKMLQRESG